MGIIYECEIKNAIHKGTYVNTHAYLFAPGVKMRLITLCYIGLGQNSLKWILSLYSNPTARLKINGTLSDPIQLQNGTRQGCPLSPLLFVLTLEPLLSTIRNNPNIQGVKVGTTQHKICAYADDLLFTLSQPITTLPNLIIEIEQYSQISNFKINYSKSSALNISLPHSSVIALKDKFSFSWTAHKLTYLGIFLTANYKDWAFINYQAILQEIKTNINVWVKMPLSWFGRVNTLKMNVLPRLLYIFQTIPLKPPSDFFLKLNKLIRKFIWNNKPPRIKQTILYRSKTEGGLGLPNFQLYHQACVLQRIIDWTYHEHYKEWISIEQSFAEQPLRLLPWLVPKHRQSLRHEHFLLEYALDTWDSLKHKHKLISEHSLLTPLTNNPAFPPGLQKGYFAAWQQDSVSQIFHLCPKASLPRWEQVQNIFTLPNSERFKYHQLTSFIAPILKGNVGDQLYTTFENLCRQKSPPVRNISSIYQNLLSQTIVSSPKPLHFLKWEKALNTQFTEQDMEGIILKSFTGQRSCRILENNYKILTGWYHTPAKLSKIFPGTSASCWRCGESPGTLLHILWECSEIKKYWMEILQVCNDKLQLGIRNDPATVLLHHNTQPISLYKKSLTQYALNAAKILIPRKWKSPTLPTINEWTQEMEDICKFEDLHTDSYKAKQNHWATWRLWRIYLGKDNRAN
uniref:Reverse transcriptase domain-containing protein n=1 Tax=Xenopus tropicalis TaxID=8364 RepID=A0A803KCX1_XENTR